ncbi:hypothetical protein FF1_008624 [Malus domestica]
MLQDYIPGSKWQQMTLPTPPIHGRIYVVPRPLVLCINIWRRMWETTRKAMSFLFHFFTSAVNMQKPKNFHSTCHQTATFLHHRDTSRTSKSPHVTSKVGESGEYESAGEGVVIGFIDTSIDPTHSNFDDNTSERPYPVPAHFSGICEVTSDFPSRSCNRKLIAARHFA